MKAYIGSENWADEGDVFFFSLASEETLGELKNLINILVEFGLFDNEIEMYWGTNESFEFNSKDLLDFIDSAKDISDEEIEIFNKFGVSGFDIYDRILCSLQMSIYFWKDWVNHTKEEIDKIKASYIRLFGIESWSRVQQYWMKSNNGN